MLELSAYSPLRFGFVSFELQALELTSLEGFVGTALRGMIGAALRDATLDQQGHPPFQGPSLVDAIFETPSSSGEQATPAPMVLEVPSNPDIRLSEGDVLEFGLTLFGQALEFVPHLTWILYRWGLMGGLGRERRHFLVKKVTASTPSGPVVLFESTGGPVATHWEEAWTWTGEDVVKQALSTVPRGIRLLRVTLESPLDLREDKRPVMKLEFAHLLRSLLRNVSAHARAHGEGPLPIDFRALKDASSEVRKVKDATDWISFERHSNRQQRNVPVTGRIGSLVFEGDLEPFVPLLALGRVVHLGKGRNMGLGAMGWDVLRE